MNRSMYATVVVAVALVLVVGVVVEAAPAGDGRIDEGGVAAFRRSLYGPGRLPERRANNQCSSNVSSPLFVVISLLFSILFCRLFRLISSLFSVSK